MFIFTLFLCTGFMWATEADPYDNVNTDLASPTSGSKVRFSNLPGGDRGLLDASESLEGAATSRPLPTGYEPRDISSQVIPFSSPTNNHASSQTNPISPNETAVPVESSQMNTSLTSLRNEAVMTDANDRVTTYYWWTKAGNGFDLLAHLAQAGSVVVSAYAGYSKDEDAVFATTCISATGLALTGLAAYARRQAQTRREAANSIFSQSGVEPIPGPKGSDHPDT